ncbi:MAG: ABC transporter ATP-binding protein [Ruminococcaceae bacterium]|nr:ABC transporter ATP-binding protein [Oscillospiraceae bacterium]
MAKRNTFEVDEKLETPFNWGHFKKALVYVKKYRFVMIGAILISLIGSIIGMFMPKIMQWVLDDAVPNKDLPLLWWLLAAYVGVLALNIITAQIRSRMMVKASQGIIFDIRKDLFAHLQKLPFSYYDSRPAGKILVRVVNNVNSVSDMLSNGLVNMLLEIMNLVVITVFMFQTEPRLATVIVAGLPVFLGVMLYLKPRQRKVWQAQANKRSNFNAYLAESIDGVRVSQMFAQQEKNISTVKRLLDACRRTWMRAIYYHNAVWFASELLTQIVVVCLYLVGIYWMGGDMVTFGVILAMSQYVSRFWTPITNLANIYNNFINNIAYLERVFETMDEPVTVDDDPDATELPDIKGEVTYEDVTFGYEPEQMIVENINFTVAPGESIALVGPTGAGKTTIVSLISRFYNLNGGRILLDGEYDVSKVTLHSLRRRTGVMMQDSFIFSGTILDNIRYGRPEATMEEVERAAKAVCAHDFIVKMKRGYYTLVNERGGGLSQGQKQLISLARTLLSDPRVLILDEATSSIDTQTEQLLQRGIRTVLKGRTSFIIAHRLSTIRHCDRIFYVGDRAILESGSHEELMAKRGLYYELYTAQLQQEKSSATSINDELTENS